MVFTIPTADTISKSIRAELDANVGGVHPNVWPNNMYILSKVFAQALHGAYVRMKWLHDQAFVSTAETDALEARGADFGVTRLSATFAGGSVLATTVVGTLIPANTRLVSATGVPYLTTLDTLATRASTVVLVQAEETGPQGNQTEGVVLSLESPITGVTDDTVVTSGGITGGSDVEADASLRARILDRMRVAPHGGAPSEWVSWAREYPGVTNVFVQRATPVPGAVTIMFMMYNTYNDGLPRAGDVSGLLTLLQELGPSDVDIHVVAPVARPVDIEVHIDPDTPEIRDNINDELISMFRRSAVPGSALDDFILSRGLINDAISIAVGSGFFSLNLPADDIVCGPGEIATLGTVTYI